MIRLEPEAPGKPAMGQPCNGCGVCCAWRPCPLGVLSTRSFQGPCAALRWDGGQKVYRCGWLLGDRRHAAGSTPMWTRLRQGLARRWIAAGIGCDSSLEVEPAGVPIADRPAEQARR